MTGAVELGHFSGDRASTIEGAVSAIDHRVFGVSETEDTVRAFYDRELQRLGWQPDRLATSMDSVELAAWGWCKGAMVFRIGIQDQPRAFRPEFYKGQTFRTVFDAGLMGRDPSRGCPTQVGANTRLRRPASARGGDPQSAGAGTRGTDGLTV